VQSLLLPEQDTWIDERLRLCAFYEPAAGAGGDFWYATRCKDDSLRLLVADVTGHGAGAAMVTAAIAGCYQALRSAAEDMEPGQLLQHIHATISHLCRGAYNVPAALLELSPSGRVSWWNAGGPSLLIQATDGSVTSKSVAGVPIGREGFMFGSMTFDLEPGGRLLIFTDGVPELPLPKGRELGMRRLTEFLEASHGLPLQQARAGILAGIREAQGDVPADDDITYVLLEHVDRPRRSASLMPPPPAGG
jgi:sigma-B regulation protein RsbU (phosphoserine phosphatase)